MGMKIFDERARKILLNTRWGSGWPGEQPQGATAEDIAYAKSKGYCFDEVRYRHDEFVRKLIEVRKEITAKDVGNAFLASLSPRRLELRSALASFAFASHFPDHQIEHSERFRVPSGATLCSVCGFFEFEKPQAKNLNVLNFERHKWGGVRHDDLIYAWFDLSQFRLETQIEPTKDDVEILRNILRIAASLPDEARPGVLAKELGGALKSNLNERRMLIEILSKAGILKPRGRPSYDNEFVYLSQREVTFEHKNDWRYPAIWWRGSDGVNTSALAKFFPDIKFAGGGS